jgi:hypothetical protein
MTQPKGSTFVSLAAYLGTYVAAWIAAHVAGFLAIVRTLFAFVAPADVVEFLTRPYVFSGLCLVAVAVIANGTKVLMWWVDNSMRHRILELEQHAPTAAGAAVTMTKPRHRRGIHPAEPRGSAGSERAAS